MMYVFILGHNPKLSVAEIMAVLPKSQKVDETSSFLIIETDEFNCAEVLGRLGGTVKIGKIIGNQISRKVTIEKLKEIKSATKLNFGISYYDSKPDNLGMEIKKELKSAGISCRLVTSRDKALSSVVVSKNKCAEFLVLGKKWLGQTCVVQNFEDYGYRDYGRPVRDMVSGSQPPKLAKIMINLAEMPSGVTILDPFCGSGTILQEALLLGYKAIGSDFSNKAIQDSKKNLEWLVNKLEIRNSKFEIMAADVRNLSKNIKSADAIVTEPYLGPPLRGRESKQDIQEIITELSELYLEAFKEFRKVLNSNGKIVIVFPAFRVGQEILELPILNQIKKMGFTQVNRDKLIYSREGQKVWRQIYIFK